MKYAISPTSASESFWQNTVCSNWWLLPTFGLSKTTRPQCYYWCGTVSANKRQPLQYRCQIRTGTIWISLTVAVESIFSPLPMYFNVARHFIYPLLNEPIKSDTVLLISYRRFPLWAGGCQDGCRVRQSLHTPSRRSLALTLTPVCSFYNHILKFSCLSTHACLTAWLFHSGWLSSSSRRDIFLKRRRDMTWSLRPNSWIS